LMREGGYPVEVVFLEAGSPTGPEKARGIGNEPFASPPR
jgi:hypothetical protein